jgi:ornithine decarboxylase
MKRAKFVLSKKVLKEQVKKLENLGIKVVYSYKTNQEVGKVLQEIPECSKINFAIHRKLEIKEIKDKSKIWFFTQAESEKEIECILDKGIINFVIDNKVDLKRILNVLKKNKRKINLSLRMKFQEHRIGTGKYFVYGMPSVEINKDVFNLKNNKYINRLGIHLHRKSQNTSEWNIISDLRDSLEKTTLDKIDFVNLGGGLPSIYRSSNVDVFNYIFKKLKQTKEWLKEKNIETFIEPGRFLAAPCIRLITEVIQKNNKNLTINTTIYNCAMDSILTNTKMLVLGESEKQEEKNYLIKGNSPTRDDIFRYSVKLNKDIKIGDKIIFLNAGAYNYTTDFFGYAKLKTEVLEDF